MFTSWHAPFFALAAAGFALSVLSHLFALTGHPGPFGPRAELLHLGIFVVWVPAIIAVNRLAGDQRRGDAWELALRGCPPWVPRAVLAVFAYALVNFVLFLATAPPRGTPKDEALPAELRGFSGHWMLFYGVAAAVLYSAMAVRVHDPAGRCPAGHPVLKPDEPCPGCALEPPPPPPPPPPPVATPPAVTHAELYERRQARWRRPEHAFSELPDARERPRPAPCRFVTLSDGRRLAYDEFGDPDGVPVVYHHGNPSCRLEAAVLADAAARHGVRLIAPDRPGCGRSDPAPQRTLLGWPRDVADLADQLGLARFAVLGVSGGAPSALACGVTLAHRVRLVAVASGWYAADPCDLPVFDRVLGRAALSAPVAFRAAFGFAGMAARLLPDAAFRLAALGVPAADRRALAAFGGRSLKSLARGAFRQGARGPALDAALGYRPWGFGPADVAVPVGLFHGTADAVTPLPAAESWARSLRHAALLRFEGEGHLSFVTHAGEVFARLASSRARSGA